MLAFYSLISTINEFYHILQVPERIKILKHKINSKNPSKFHIIEYNKLKNLNLRINKWDIAIIIGNLAQLLGSVMSLFDDLNVTSYTNFFIGYSSMSAFLCIGKYLDYNTKYASIYQTLTEAFPKVIKFFVGLLPIFIAFSFLGLCLFWRSERFTCLSDVIKTLYAIVNGDSIWDIISDITGVSYFWGQIYGYLFTLLFLVVVMNVFISILQEAYTKIRMSSQSHWVYDYRGINTEKKDDDEFGYITSLKTEDKYKEIKEKLNILEEDANKITELKMNLSNMQMDAKDKEEINKFLNENIKEMYGEIDDIFEFWRWN